MADHLGRIEVPSIAPFGTFPIALDYPFVTILDPEVYVHRFGLYDAKAEQRFYAGPRERGFLVRRVGMGQNLYDSLRAFWYEHQGAYAPFTLNYPNPDKTSASTTARFADPTITFPRVTAAISSIDGLLLKEVLTGDGPTYPLNSVVTRFPTSDLALALLDQVQEIIPLLRIIPLDETCPQMFVSDRRCTIDTQLYQARLLDWNGVSQSLGASDQANFVFGNADQVMTAIANDVDLFRASVQFSLYHVGTGVRIDLWAGTVTDWQGDLSGQFSLSAADGVYELTLSYPLGSFSRTCLKPYNNAVGGCDWTSRSGIMHNIRSVPNGRQEPDGGQAFTVLNFNPDSTQCDRGFDTPNGCLAHGMETRFGGQVCNPQTIVTKDNSTGFAGIGRSKLTSASLVNDSLYDQAIPETWYEDLRGDAWPSVGPNIADTPVRLYGEYPSGATAIQLCGLIPDKSIRNGDMFSICYPNSNPASLGDWFLYTIVADALSDASGIASVTITPALKPWDYHAKGAGLFAILEVVLDFVVPPVGAVVTVYSDLHEGDAIPETGWGVIPEYATMGMPMQARMAEGRDEGDFYVGLGVICAGPIGSFAKVSPGNCQQLIDGTVPHGLGKNMTADGGCLGLRLGRGDDPVDLSNDNEKFSLGEGGDGVQYFADTLSAGIAFGEIRRQDDKGLQLSQITDHSMQLTIRQGMYGYVWTGDPGGPYTRTVVPGLTNLAWVAINVYLRGRGLWSDPITFPTGVTSDQQMAAFDVDAAIAYAAICDLQVPKLVGLGMETQFLFGGVMSETKALRDWLQEILNGGLGYFTFSFDKLRIGCRINSSVSEAPAGGPFTEANVLFESLTVHPAAPSFNHLKIIFGDRAYGFTANNVVARDDSHAMYLARGAGIPQYRKKEFAQVGICDISQAARVGITRLREELGGITLDQWKAARKISFQTTVLGLGTEPGQVCSFTDPVMPDYAETFVYHTTLDGDILAADTTIAANDPLPSGVILPLLVVIGTEQIWITAGYSGGSGTSLTITRGANSTTAADHADGATLDDINYQAAQAGYLEWRVDTWKLNRDFSIEISGRSTHNDVYDLTYGPKPADAVALPVPVSDLHAPQDWTCAADTDGDGMLTLRDIACGQYGNAVQQGRFSVYYIPEDISTYGTIVGGGPFGSTGTTFSYSGTPPTVGKYVMLDAEILYVVSVTLPVGGAFGTVTVKRAQLGTAAAVHDRIAVTCSAVDPDFSCRYTVDAGANLRAGSAIVINDGSHPAINQRIIASYNNDTGELVTMLPLAITVGMPLYSDVRLWRVEKLDVVVPFATRFFSSPSRSNWTWPIPLPFAGVVLILGTLTNTRGLDSETIAIMPVSLRRLEQQFQPWLPAYPYRARTMGGHRYLMHYAAHPAALTVQDLEPALPPHGQPWVQAYARAGGDGTGNIDAPPAVNALLRSSLTPSGQLTVSGAIVSTAMIQVGVAQPGSASGAAITAPTWLADAFGITSSSTTDDVAESLATWLSYDETFASYYDVTVSGSVITLTDKQGNGGLLEVEALGVTVTPAGFSSALGVLHGRRYALAYVGDVGGSYLSALSPLSPSTNPTGDATQIEIHGLPKSTDTRVGHVKIYATPDGLDTPLRLVGTADNGDESFNDDITETALASAALYPGESQPATGAITITLTRNGSDWGTLFIPSSGSHSNSIDGFALDPCTANTVLNASIDNSAGVPDTDVTISIE